MRNQNALEANQKIHHTPLYVIRNHQLRSIKNDDTLGMRARYFTPANKEVNKNLALMLMRALPWVILMIILLIW